MVEYDWKINSYDSNEKLMEAIKHLRNLIFKMNRNEKGEVVFTLSEGMIANKFHLTTNNVLGKTALEVFPGNLGVYLNEIFIHAMNGKTSNHEVQIGDMLLFTEITPIFQDGTIREIVGTSFDITERKNLENQIVQYKNYNMYSGLTNHTVFIDRFNLLIDWANHSESSVALIVLNLDHFQLFNETFGYEFGNKLLKEVGNRLLQLDQAYIISHFFADEYTILVSNLKDYDSLFSISEKLLNTVSKPLVIEDQEIIITGSIGISVYPIDGDTSDTLLNVAKGALNRAKEIGGNNLQFYAPDAKLSASGKLKLLSELRKSLHTNQLEIHYQPIINLSSGNVTGVESLLRWHHPKLGKISPIEFIPLAEEYGVIDLIDQFVLESVIRQAKIWKNNGLPFNRVTINLSLKNFPDNNFAKKVTELIAEYNIEPHLIELEITETQVVNNIKSCIQVFKELRELGIKIAIDDFGTGYSSLLYLKKIPFDTLKIDQQFIHDLAGNTTSQALVQFIIDLSRKLDVEVVCEGIETIEQLTLLKEFKDIHGQGYLFSRPIKSHSFETLLSNGDNLGYLYDEKGSLGSE